MARLRNLNLDALTGSSSTEEDKESEANVPEPRLVKKNSTPRDEKPSPRGEAYSTLFNCAVSNLSGASPMFSSCAVELDIYLKEVDKKGPKR